MSEQAKFSAAQWAFDLLTADSQRTLLLQDQKKISAAALHEDVSRIRASLTQAGLGQDRIVAVACERSASSLAVILACLCENISPFLIDPRQDHDVLAKLLDAVRVHGLFCGESMKSEMFRARLPYLKWVGESESVMHASRATAPEESLEGSFLLHSSGTCGLPRALHHSGSAISWQAGALAKNLRLKPGSELWFTGSIAQPSVFSMGLCAVLSAGGTLVLDDPETKLSIAPRLSEGQRLLLLSQFTDSQTWNAEKLLALKGKVSATMTTDFSLSESFAVTVTQATDAPVWNGWSLAEVAGFLTVNPIPGVWPSESVGRPLAGAEVRGLENESTASDGLSRLFYRHAPVPQKVISLTFQGKSEHANLGNPTDDWGRVDANDFIFVDGCEKSVFYRAGFPIEARQVEAQLVSLDGIKESLVFGLPNDDVETEVATVIVPSNGKTDFASSISELSKTTPRYMLPQRLSIAESLQRTPTGKYVRHGLPTSGKPVVLQSDSKIVPPARPDESDHEMGNEDQE